MSADSVQAEQTSLSTEAISNIIKDETKTSAPSLRLRGVF